MSSQTRVLDKSEIKKFVEDDEARLIKQQRWPSIKYKRLILKAIKNKQEFVLLGGVRFDMKYKPNTDEVFISPLKSTGSYIPCGWFSIKGLEKELLGVKGDG